jgi:hypothetical protein
MKLEKLDKSKMSLKLWKKLKALERKEKHVQFGQMLDQISIQINAPIKRRTRRSNV